MPYDGLSERDFDSYINFRIILFHIPFAIFGLEFPHDIVNPITVCYWFTEIFKVGSTSRFLYQFVSEP
jgi:hypothetical protein